MNEKISIIVPIYNVEQYLDKCLQSILHQNYHNIEVIMVNDGSTDNSLEVAKKYSDKYPNFILINQENQGLSGARNTGLKHVKGDYVFFLDSDDYLSDNCLSELIRNMGYNTDIVETNFHYAYIDKKDQLKKYQTSHDINKIDFEKDINKLVTINATSCGRLYRKELLDNIFFPSGLFYEDVYFTNCILPRIKKFKKVEKGIYYHFQREGSITHTFNDRIFEMLNVQEGIYNYYLGNNYLPKYYEVIQKNAIKLLVVVTLGQRALKYDGSRLEENYYKIKEFINEKYPNYMSNHLLTIKEKIFTKFILMNYFNYKTYLKLKGK